jgi:hypothetical protein
MNLTLTTYLGDNCIVFENFMLNKLYDIAWFGSDQTSVYTLGEIHKNRNNSTVFEELEVSIVDLTVANIRFTGSASRRQ